MFLALFSEKEERVKQRWSSTLTIFAIPRDNDQRDTLGDAFMTFLFLGTGGSAGVPMVGCQCSVCKSDTPHNQRLRPSGLLKLGDKTFLIDPGPDLRFQALKYNIAYIDGVLITHTHFDHVGGLDELRTYYLLHGQIMPCLVSLETLEGLKHRYDYLFAEKTWGKSLAAQLHFQVLEQERGTTEFLHQELQYVSYMQGQCPVNGFRFDTFAYISDIRKYPDTIFEDLQGVETLVLSAVRDEPSQMHLSFDEGIDFSKRVGAKKTYFTHISHETDHEKANKKLPKGFQVAYDGLTLDLCMKTSESI